MPLADADLNPTLADVQKDNTERYNKLLDSGRFGPTTETADASEGLNAMARQLTMCYFGMPVAPLDIGLPRLGGSNSGGLPRGC